MESKHKLAHKDHFSTSPPPPSHNSTEGKPDGFRPPQAPLRGPPFTQQHVAFQQQQFKQPADPNSGIFSSLSSGFNSLVSNIFG
ncbi:Hypothetical predicted protein [Cloeon dipterum]|uniref:Uncharacterized protein n=1 Tax=Cloeon dipterum TaxID=197152 RepID=A0A8S1DN71_9INSE|nr:Hypothetical predicted protein [Cloeon dipterum]